MTSKTALEERPWNLLKSNGARESLPGGRGSVSVLTRDALHGKERGVTLIEMVVVMLLVALMAALSFPAVSSGIDTLRVSGAARDIAAFFNSGLNRAQRRQQAVEVVVSQKDNRLWMVSVEPGFRRELRLPDTVSIQGIFPELESPPDQPRSFLLYPGGSTPAMGVMLKGNHGAVRTVRVDPVIGVPSVTTPEL